MDSKDRINIKEKLERTKERVSKKSEKNRIGCPRNQADMVIEEEIRASIGRIPTTNVGERTARIDVPPTIPKAHHKEVNLLGS